MDKNEMINDKLTKVCLCKGVSKHTIKKCIREGAKTDEEVSQKCGATTGGCKGRRCIDKINELINEYKVL